MSTPAERISIARSVATALLQKDKIDRFAAARVMRDVAELAEELVEKIKILKLDVEHRDRRAADEAEQNELRALGLPDEVLP